jgi:hypothetical protein
MSVAKAKEEISSEEFIKWQVFHSTNPLMPERLDYLFAIFMFMFANANSSGKKKLNFNDFIPVWYKKEVTEKDLEMKLLQLKHSYPHKVYKEKT